MLYYDMIFSRQSFRYMRRISKHIYIYMLRHDKSPSDKSFLSESGMVVADVLADSLLRSWLGGYNVGLQQLLKLLYLVPELL